MPFLTASTYATKDADGSILATKLIYDIESAYTFDEEALLDECKRRVPDAHSRIVTATVMAINGYSAATIATLKGKIKAGEKTVDIAETIRKFDPKIGSNSKTGSNGLDDKTGLTAARICQVHRYAIAQYLNLNKTVQPALYRKYGKALGLDRMFGFVGAESLINSDEQAIRFVGAVYRSDTTPDKRYVQASLRGFQMRGYIVQYVSPKDVGKWVKKKLTPKDDDELGD